MTTIDPYVCPICGAEAEDTDEGYRCENGHDYTNDDLTYSSKKVRTASINYHHQYIEQRGTSNK